MQPNPVQIFQKYFVEKEKGSIYVQLFFHPFG